MVGVMSYFFQIVVLPAYANTLLGIGGSIPILSLMLKRIFFSQKYRFELIHPRVGEKQRGIILGYYRSTIYNSVFFFSKEIKKFLTYLGRSLVRH